MKKKTNTQDGFNKEVEQKTLGSIRECAVNIRKFSHINSNLFTTLKTSKKEMLQKEVNNISELINQL